VCWCDGRKILRRRCRKDFRAVPEPLAGLLPGDCDEDVSEEACIQADSTRNLKDFRIAPAEHFTTFAHPQQLFSAQANQYTVRFRIP